MNAIGLEFGITLERSQDLRLHVGGLDTRLYGNTIDHADILDTYGLSTDDRDAGPAGANACAPAPITPDESAASSKDQDIGAIRAQHPAILLCRVPCHFLIA